MIHSRGELSTRCEVSPCTIRGGGTTGTTGTTVSRNYSRGCEVVSVEASIRRRGGFCCEGFSIPTRNLSMLRETLHDQLDGMGRNELSPVCLSSYAASGPCRAVHISRGDKNKGTREASRTERVGPREQPQHGGKRESCCGRMSYDERLL